ncbi:MAG: VWA domain-containing protein [Gammaproteobacteria bacterium]|jgi:Ca-activated chloride channel homolog|nr:VWA domain-containing protein [Gammaproteobacteria bacterium]
MKIFKKKAIAIAITVFVVACAQNDEQAKQSVKPLHEIEETVVKSEKDIDQDGPALKEDIFRAEKRIALNKQLSAKSKLNPMERKRPATASRRQDMLMSAPANIAIAGAVSMDNIRASSEPLNRENYAHFNDNPVKLVSEYPVSTFSIDVDTGSYANIRRMLNAGSLPAKDAVRTEELLNYFSYKYPAHALLSAPFALHKEISASPWNPDTHLLHIGIKGYDIPLEQLPASNLVFLVDVSGSMQSANKLELLKSSLKLLTRRLSPEDSVSIVVYAGASGVVLEPTSGKDKALIISALDRLTAGGSTNGAAGIRLAYAMAEQAFIKGGINRVLLATDGDFNVGTTNTEQLKDLIEQKRKSGIALSTLGFGTGNYNDQLMEQIADVGNGNYAYIDTLHEAQKVLVDELSSTMLTIAKDVKIQIEFNPAVVTEYRLLGYENRLLNREDFNNDKVDAGEIGAGHTVTAIYEVSLKGSESERIDALRYQSVLKQDSNASEIAFLRLRYKEPEAKTSQLLEWVIAKDEIIEDIEKTSNAFRFAAAVASFAQQLRGGVNTKEYTYEDIAELAQNARGEDPFGYRVEFLSLIKLTQSISQPEQHAQLTK